MGLKVFLIICIKDFLGKRTRAYITDVIVILTPIGYSTFGEDARSVGTIAEQPKSLCVGLCCQNFARNSISFSNVPLCGKVLAWQLNAEPRKGNTA